MSASEKFSESLRQGERRIVTVIFADVSGFTAMSEKLDPEDVRDIMNRCFSMLSQAVYEQKGVVDKYVGDCVMALFGVPHAQEDDAVRAVRAALKMQTALKSFGEELKRSRGFSLSMRIGINTGLVIAGDVGSSQKSDFTVMGDAVNTASRIEHSAAVGKVWISRETHRFVKDRFEFKKLEPMAIKGKEKKLQFYEIVEPSDGAATAPSGACPQAAYSGRKKELRALSEALELSMLRQCTVVSLVGEAGLGKTQLLKRFLKDIQPETEAGRLDVVTSTCPPQGTGAYGIFVDISKRFFNGNAISESEPNWKEKYFLAFEKWLMQKSAQKPLLLVLEDIHFADAGSWELLGFLVNRLRKLPIMILCLFRPVSEKNLYWHSAENYVPVYLKPFNVPEGIRIVNQCLGKNQLLESFKEKLVVHAGGNPYFLTEIIWSLTESGALTRKKGAWVLSGKSVRLKIPDTVQTTLLVRLDQLPAEEKELLQAASVLGLEFDRKFLASLMAQDAGTEPLLENLVTKRFLSKVIKPQGDMETFEFIHVLLQEVCYESLLNRKKEAYHLLAAKLLEESYPAQGEADFYLSLNPWQKLLEESYPTREGAVLKQIADHYYRSSDRAKAFRYQLEFAQKAARQFAMDQGILYYRRALEILGDAREMAGVSRSAILFNLGELHIPSNEVDKALAYFKECLALQAPQDPFRIEVYRKIGRIYNIQGQAPLALEMLIKAAAPRHAPPELPTSLSSAKGPAHPGPGSSPRPSGASGSQDTVPGAATGAADSESGLSTRQRAELCYEVAANYFRQGDDSEALSWIGKVSRAVQELGIQLELPSGDDIHELMPVFSFLTEKN